MKRSLGAGGILVAAAIAAQGLLVAGVAQADAGGNASVQGSVLVYTANPGFTNNVVITLSNGLYTISDVVAIDPGPGCSGGPVTKVTCIASGVTSIKVNSGDLDDNIANQTSTPSTLWGDAGDDVITGGFGNDILRGGTGADTMSGRAGRDGVTYFGVSNTVVADADNEVGDDGERLLPFFQEHDTIKSDVEDLYGGNGNDRLVGTDKANTLVGNDGNDTLIGNEGDDWLSGGADDDTMDGNAGADRFTGSVGIDTVSYATHSIRVVADPDGVSGDDGTPGTDFTPPEGDTIDADVENLTGTPFPDTLTGNSLDNFIAGGNGVDTIDGGLGNDELDGGAAGDTLIGNLGNDTVSYRFRVNVVKAALDPNVTSGENGEGDTISFSVENLIGGAGNDILTGNGAANKLFGLGGDDSLDGVGAGNTLDGGTHMTGDICKNGPTFINCNP